jgi:hypothetical protein
MSTLWASFEGRCILSGLVSACGLLLWWRWPTQLGRGSQITWLLALAALTRVAFLPLPASDDVHRYIWEGQLLLAGHSPYTTTADQPPSELWQDENWQRMNHRDKRTAYPPLALGLCALVELIQGKGIPSKLDHAFGFKVATALADLLLVCLLASAVKELRWVALYAVNPLPLISYSAEGHLDIWMVLPMVASVVWRQRPQVAWCCLALAIGIKLIAILLLPVLWHHTPHHLRRRCLLLALLTLVLPALPFYSTWPGLLTGIYSFGAHTSGNATLHWLLELATGSKTLAVAGSFILMALWMWHRRSLLPLPSIAAREYLTALLIAAPTVTYWYPGWALPFAVLAPHPALWVLSATDIFYYAAWAEAEHTGVWWQPRWAWACLWLPFLACWLYGQSRMIHQPKAQPIRFRSEA